MLQSKTSYHDQMAYLYPPKNENSHVRDITIQVTENCNLCCSYCYQVNKTINAMDFETAKQFIDILFDNREDPDAYYNIYNTCGFVINFIGGEPLLEIDLIDKIIEYTESRVLELKDDLWLYTHCYNFSTNGTLYFEPKVEAFREKWGPLVSMSITVDGNKELHDSCRVFPNGKGSYDLAARASWNELIKGHDASKITISPNNVSYIFEGIKHFINKGHRFVEANCVFEDVWNKESALELYNQLIKLSDWITENNLYDKIFVALLDVKKYTKTPEHMLNHNWCGVGKGGMSALDYTGKIYPCIRFMPSSSEKDIPLLTIGDINNGYLNTERDKENFNLLKQCTRKNLEPEECLKCPISSGCSWCSGQVYEHYNGNFTQKTTFICDTHKMSALATKYLAKINNDKKSYDLIQLDYCMYEDLINKEDFDKINKWKEEEDQ